MRAVLVLFFVRRLQIEQGFFFFSSRRRHTRYWRDWSSDVCSSDLVGPYALEVAGLISRHAAAIRSALGRYDDLVTNALSAPSRAVLTHGEPHPGNTMRTVDGWVLIDWDTARVAPPERDLWSLDPGDGTMHAAYAERTGTALRPALLELYRRRWDLADVAVDVARLRRAHEGTAEDAKTF